MKTLFLGLAGLVLGAAIVFLPGCGGEEGGGTYACRYEDRHTECGPGDWLAWESECYEFNIDDYLEGWTPEQVCDKWTGSDSNCELDCCINIEYQNNELSEGGC